MRALDFVIALGVFMMNQDAVELSIIIVSWNVATFLEACLRSIEQNASEVNGEEVIVVDNASTDNSVEMVQRLFPAVQLVCNQANNGFAFANNQAFQQARGRYLMLLNPDTVVRPGAFRNLINYLEQNTHVGLAGAQLILENGEIQLYSARRLPTLVSELLLVALPGGRLPMFGKFLEQKLAFPYDYDRTQEVESVSGAALMIRRIALIQIGFLDHQFFHCGEDVEWCHRARRSGWQVAYVHDARITHFSGQSSLRNIKETTVNAILSIHYYFQRAFGSRHAIVYMLIMRLVYSPWIMIATYIQLMIGRLSWKEFLLRFSISLGIFKWKYVGAAATRKLAQSSDSMRVSHG